jgi:hypothetical protein
LPGRLPSEVLTLEQQVLRAYQQLQRQGSGRPFRKSVDVPIRLASLISCGGRVIGFAYIQHRQVGLP